MWMWCGGARAAGAICRAHNTQNPAQYPRFAKVVCRWRLAAAVRGRPARDAHRALAGASCASRLAPACSA